MDGYSLNAVISGCRMQPQLFWCSFLVSQMFDMPLGSPFTDTWLMAIADVGPYLLTVFQELSSECHSCLCNISQRCWSDWHFWSQVLPLGSSSGVFLGMLFQPFWGKSANINPGSGQSLHICLESESVFHCRLWLQPFFYLTKY